MRWRPAEFTFNGDGGWVVNNNYGGGGGEARLSIASTIGNNGGGDGGGNHLYRLGINNCGGFLSGRHFVSPGSFRPCCGSMSQMYDQRSDRISPPGHTYVRCVFPFVGRTVNFDSELHVHINSLHLCWRIWVICIRWKICCEGLRTLTRI